MSRRSLVQSAAAFGVAYPGLFQQGAKVLGETRPGAAGRIDVQFHFSPTFYTERVKPTRRIATERWSVEAALSYMDKNGVAAGIMSVSTPGVNFLPAADSVALARRLNEAAGEIVRARVEEMVVVYSTAKPPVMIDEAMHQIAAFYYDLAISAHENARGRCVPFSARAMCCSPAIGLMLLIVPSTKTSQDSSR